MSMSSSQRVTQVIQAADELLRRLLLWITSERRSKIVPDNVSLQIQAVETLARQSEMPDACLALQTAACRLAEEYRAYARRDPSRVQVDDGSPVPRFWAAVKALAVARQSADQPLRERLEPVATLLKQGVSHSQIGRHIYGRRGVGPFIQQNGDVDVSLIEQEAEKPGSVIPADWVPPWVEEAEQERQATLAERLKVFTDQEEIRQYEDPCTVEEMLQQGAFVQQIERAKRVSRREVLEAAKRIGIEPVDGPAYQAEIEDDADDTDDADSESGADSDADSDADADSEPDEESTDPDSLKKQIIELHKSGTMGAPEIAQEMRRRGHMGISSQAVSAIVGHWKRRQLKEAPAVSG